MLIDMTSKASPAKFQVQEYILPKSGEIHYMDSMVTFARNLAIFQNILASQLNAGFGAGSANQATASFVTNPEEAGKNIQSSTEMLDQLFNVAKKDFKSNCEFINPTNYKSALMQYNQFIEEQLKTSTNVSNKIDEIVKSPEWNSNNPQLQQKIQGIQQMISNYYKLAITLMMSEDNVENEKNFSYCHYIEMINRGETMLEQNVTEIYQSIYNRLNQDGSLNTNAASNVQASLHARTDTRGIKANETKVALPEKQGNQKYYNAAQERENAIKSRTLNEVL